MVARDKSSSAWTVKPTKAHAENVALKIEPGTTALNDGNHRSQQPKTVKNKRESKGMKNLSWRRIRTVHSQSEVSLASTADTAATNCSSADTAATNCSSADTAATNCSSAAETKTQEAAAPTEWANVMPVTLHSTSWCDIQDSGDEWLPSMGSKRHHLGSCKPCVFVHKDRGCTLGSACDFCHLCSADVLYLQRLRRRRGLNKRMVDASPSFSQAGLNKPTVAATPLPASDVPTDDVRKIKADKKMRRKLRNSLEYNCEQRR